MGGVCPPVPYRCRCYPVTLQRKRFYPLFLCAVTDSFLHNEGGTPPSFTRSVLREGRHHPRKGCTVGGRHTGSFQLRIHFCVPCWTLTEETACHLGRRRGTSPEVAESLFFSRPSSVQPRFFHPLLQARTASRLPPPMTPLTFAPPRKVSTPATTPPREKLCRLPSKNPLPIPKFISGSDARLTNFSISIPPPLPSSAPTKSSQGVRSIVNGLAAPTAKKPTANTASLSPTKQRKNFSPPFSSIPRTFPPAAILPNMKWTLPGLPAATRTMCASRWKPLPLPIPSKAAD